MAIRKTLASIVLVGALALGVAGCGNEADKPQSRVGEYASQPAVPQNVETFSQLEGKIVKVQPSEISYAGTTITLSDRLTANHEFEYVIVEGRDGKPHIFIYPYSKAILERDATIEYRPLNSGMITAGTFIRTFLGPKYFTDANVTIEAEGIITKGGIKYK